jgi:hypothetical protein
MILKHTSGAAVAEERPNGKAERLQLCLKTSAYSDRPSHCLVTGRPNINLVYITAPLTHSSNDQAISTCVVQGNGTADTQGVSRTRLECGVRLFASENPRHRCQIQGLFFGAPWVLLPAGYLFGVPKKNIWGPKIGATCGSRGMFRSNESTATAGETQVYCL